MKPLSGQSNSANFEAILQPRWLNTVAEKILMRFFFFVTGKKIRISLLIGYTIFYTIVSGLWLLDTDITHRNFLKMFGDE